MSKNTPDLENKTKCYLDEKELFILYSLYRHKRISAMWSNVFVPNPKKVLVKPEDTPEELFDRLTYRGQSVIILQYLLDLGKEIDRNGFSIYCNADYALVEGGFLTDDFDKEMYEYLELPKDKRDKNKILTEEQKEFLENIISGKSSLDDVNIKVKFTKLSNPPIKAYKEAVLEKKADKDFIALVNKLITDYDNGKWITEDVEKFLEISYRHNKEQFKKNAMTKKTFLYEDAQKKLARLIFENVDIRLSIKNTEKLEHCLNTYIEQFKNDELDKKCRSGLTGRFFSSELSIPLHTKMFGFKKQKEILLKYIEEQYNKYQRVDLEIGHPYFEPEYTGDNKKDNVKITLSETEEEQELFLFVHTMITLSHNKEFKIEDFCYGKKGIFDMYDRGFLFQIKIAKNLFTNNTKKVYLDAKKSLSFVSFNSNNGLINLTNKEIKLTLDKNPYYIMQIISQEPEKLWNYDELWEKLYGTKYEPQNWNKIYQAAYAVNEAVAKKTTTQDFLVITKTTVSMNSKYLQ